MLHLIIPASSHDGRADGRSMVWLRPARLGNVMVLCLAVATPERDGGCLAIVPGPRYCR